MSEIALFDVEGNGWRFGRDDDGTSWAVATDLAKSFDHRDAEKVTRLLEEDEKGTRIVGTPGGPQELAVVFEDGIWELIFLSRKPEAKAIKKRVKAILKQIRQTGSYGVDPFDSVRNTLTWAETAATIEQRYRIPCGEIGLRRTLRSVGIIKQGGTDPKRAYRDLFHFTGTCWEIYPSSIPFFVRKIDKALADRPGNRYHQLKLGEDTGAPELRAVR